MKQDIKLIDFIKKYEWEQGTRRVTTLHRFFDFSEASEGVCHKMFGTGMSQQVLIMEKGDISRFQTNADWNSFIKGLTQFFNKPSSISWAQKHMTAGSDAFIDWLKNNCRKTSLQKLSNNDLAKILMKRHDGHQVLLAWQWFGFVGKYPIDEILHTRLKKYSLSDDEIKVILTHKQPISIVEEELAIKKIAYQIQLKKINTEGITKKLKSHLRKFSYIVIYDETSDPMNLEFIQKRIAGYIENKNLGDEIREAYAQFKRNREEFRNLLTKHKFNKNDLALIIFSDEFAHFMEIRNNLRSLAARYSRGLFEIIAKRIGLTTSELLCFTDYEINEALLGNSILTKEEAKDRYEYSAVITHKKDCLIVIDKSAAEISSIVKKKFTITEIKGIATNRGIVCGKVKIVVSRNDLGKVEKGDILVSPMTEPVFLMAMKKAAAVVTDEGGALCHAAIISRELHIPCIVGTKIATQILKDGDLVEVDANAGVVRILEKSRIQSEEKLIEMAKKFNWQHWLDRIYHPFIFTLYCRGVDAEYFTKVDMDGFDFNPLLYQFPIIYQSEELTKRNQDLLDKYFCEKTIFDISKSIKRVHEKNRRECGALLKNKNLSPIEKLSEVQEIIRSYGPFLWIMLSLERYYDQRIAEESPKYIKGNIEKFIGDVSVPKKKNAYVKMLDMLDSGAPLEDVQKKFGWIKCRDGLFGFYTIDELQEIKGNHKVLQRHRITIPKQLKKLIEEIRELTYFRTDRTDKYFEMLVLARPIFQEVADYIGVSLDELAYYDSESIISGSPRKISKEFSALYIDGNLIIRNKPIINFLPELDAEIKGAVAYKGVVQGIVRIVRQSFELKKVKRGEILVSQMTFPSFISAMQKAAAFVTDEGGITCHAAIIAREMKKPCIIGTKIATQVLHDGDLVEVDADSGVVKILEK
jgi:phosphoenolpyruvate synthase/pyruvate phosphate dikinase